MRSVSKNMTYLTGAEAIGKLYVTGTFLVPHPLLDFERSHMQRMRRASLRLPTIAASSPSSSPTLSVSKSRRRRPRTPTILAGRTPLPCSPSIQPLFPSLLTPLSTVSNIESRLKLSICSQTADNVISEVKIPIKFLKVRPFFPSRHPLLILPRTASSAASGTTSRAPVRARSCSRGASRPSTRSSPSSRRAT